MKHGWFYLIQFYSTVLRRGTQTRESAPYASAVYETCLLLLCYITPRFKQEKVHHTHIKMNGIPTLHLASGAAGKTNFTPNFHGSRLNLCVCTRAHMPNPDVSCETDWYVNGTHDKCMHFSMIACVIIYKYPCNCFAYAEVCKDWL